MYRKKQEVSRKHIVLLGGFLLLIVLGLSGGAAFTTFNIGDNYSFDIDWSGAKANDDWIYENGEVTGVGSVSFAENGQIINFGLTTEGGVYTAEMNRNSDGMPYATIAASFSNFKYMVPIGGLDVGYPVSNGEFVSTYVSTTSGGYVYDRYKLQFTVYLRTYSSVLQLASPLTYTPSNGESFDVMALPSTAAQNVILNLDVETMVGSGAFVSSTFKVLGIKMIQSDADSDQRIIRYTDAVNYDEIIYSEYYSEGEYPNDAPQMTLLRDFSVSNDIPLHVTGGMEDVRTAIGFRVAPGAAYVDGVWLPRELYTALTLEMDLEIVRNEYETAKLMFLAGLINILPKQIGYGYIKENIVAFIVVIGFLVVIPLYLIIRGTRTYRAKWGP